MTDQAGHHHLVHGVDQPGRAAGAAERVADIDRVGDRRPFAAKLGGNENAEQTLFFGGLDCLFRKSRRAIDRGSMFRSDLRYRLRTSCKIGGWRNRRRRDFTRDQRRAAVQRRDMANAILRIEQ